MNLFKDKIVVVTGASSGIGAETALSFAREGANVVITYRENKAGADEIAKQINTIGSECLVVQADLINEKDAKNVVEKTMQEFGRIDVLVNNAGRYIDGDEWNVGAEVWTKSL